MSRVEKIVLALTILGAASPAFAGISSPVPAPVAGMGIGAVVLVGIGYRALKRRINS